MSAETLETTRLRLRPVTLNDASRMADLLSDRDVSKMTAKIPHPYGLDDARDFIAASTKADVRPGLFAVDHRQHGFVGMMGLNSELERFPVVGYWLGRPYWGQGLATEALGGLLTWADRRNVRAVISEHFVDNEASGRVLGKGGFLYTGEVAPKLSRARGEAVLSRRMVRLA